MSKIIAEKDGIKRSFSIVAWDLLGKEKSGWVQIPEEVSKNNSNNSKAFEDKNPIGDSIKTSKDFTADKAIIKLKELKTSKEIDSFVKGETRVGLKTVVEKIKLDLSTKKENKEK